MDSNPKSTLVDAVFDNQAMARSIAYRLNNISSQMHSLGIMQSIGEELELMGQDYLAMAERLVKTHSDDLHATIQHDTKMAHEIVLMAIEVAPAVAQYRKEKA